MLALRRPGVLWCIDGQVCLKNKDLVNTINVCERRYLIFTLLKFKSVKITIISTTTLTNTGCKRKGNFCEIMNFWGQ